jgi:transcriptional regulator with AAA-type ATPase domain
MDVSGSAPARFQQHTADAETAIDASRHQPPFGYHQPLVTRQPSSRPPPRRHKKSDTLEAAPSAVPVPRISLWVEHEAGVTAGREVVLDGEICRIGSHPSNELVLDDPQVSKFHCSMRRSDASWRITDSGSLNGTQLNGVRVRDADLPVDRSTIEIGQSRVVVSETGSVTKEALPVSPAFGDIVGTSVAMRRMFGVLERVAASESTVLIQGESGTGKEAIAHEIVRRGARGSKPLVVVDCGAISPSLMESELFGHAKGAFTGAQRDRVGAFEEADGGTVVLDEIGELPFEMQPKLLRVLEAGQVRRLGENRARAVDVRVIAATNRRLEREVNHGRFREDLYFRLSVVTVRVPPLREHLEDLPTLVGLFLRKLNARDRKHLFTPEVIDEMKRYEWPGNVRELRNYVERAVCSTWPARRPRAAPGCPQSMEPPASISTIHSPPQRGARWKNSSATISLRCSHGPKATSAKRRAKLAWTACTCTAWCSATA